MPNRHFGHFLTEASKALVLARACAALKEHELSLELVKLAKQEFEIKDGGGSLSLQQAFSEDLAQMTCRRIMIDFSNPKVSRSELLKRLERFTKTFPKAKDHKKVLETARILHAMLAEDRAHQSPPDITKLSSEQHIAELIFQLRDSHRGQWGKLVYLSEETLDHITAFSDENSEDDLEPGAAKQLLEMGFDAVPQLIAILDDERLTRDVVVESERFLYPKVLRYRDLASQLLNKISNDGIHDLAKFDPFGADAKDPPSYKDRAQQWWKEARAKGERQFLIEALESGRWDKIANANRLAAKYPDTALQPLINCEMDTNLREEKCELIKVIASLGEPAEDYLLDEMKNGVNLSSRVTAAKMLQSRMPETTNESMLADWAGINRNGRFADMIRNEQSDGVALLIRYFAAQGSAEYIAMLHKSYEKHSIANRMEMVLAVCDPKSNWNDHEVFLSNGNPNFQRNEETVNAIESLLITALHDTQEKIYMTGDWGNFVFNQPRICDIAAYFLQSRFQESINLTLMPGLQLKTSKEFARSINGAGVMTE